MNGLTLKCIAVVSMLIDHVGAVLFPQYRWMRAIGRIAFPIYCFLLVEGYSHTRNVKKYLLRLGLFALISEIPFNLAFSGVWIDPDGTNVFFTLFLGLLAIHGCEFVKKKWEKYSLLGIGSFVVCGVVAEVVLDTDYGAWGILLIFILYEFKDQKIWEVVFSGVVFWCMTKIELFGLLAFIPIFLYNGKRGPNPPALKIGFYLFYPVHLLVIHLIWRMIYLM